jgi:hypothetical protein
MRTEVLELALTEEGEIRISDGRNVADGDKVVEAGLSALAEFFLLAGHGNRRAELAVGAGVTSQ